ncbi:hypothetical protein TNCV_1148711 [Trichonephila clavipes]|nr:hypothetical protein TNCV_1148711 [Trichonephila clavipes]
MAGLSATRSRTHGNRNARPVRDLDHFAIVTISDLSSDILTAVNTVAGVSRVRVLVPLKIRLVEGADVR